MKRQQLICVHGFAEDILVIVIQIIFMHVKSITGGDIMSMG